VGVELAAGHRDRRDREHLRRKGSMAKLHELLAVKPTREGETDALVKDHAKKFKADLHLFGKVKKVFEPATEETGGKTPEPVVEEDTVLVTTLAKELAFVLGKFADCMDLLYMIDVGNVVAREDVVLGARTFATGVPATFLVHVEKRLNQILDLATGMATADPAAGYAPDASMGANVLKAEPIRRSRTAKVESYMSVAKATDKHPEQVVKVTKDVVTGHLTTTNWTSLPTVDQKSQMISRIVALKDAVAQARARANCVDVAPQKMFGEMVAYIMEPMTK
jgi:hypothetical protein